MRGADVQQGGLFSYVWVEERVPTDHRLRAVRKPLNETIQSMYRDFERVYAEGGRASIPPERLVRPYGRKKKPEPQMHIAAIAAARLLSLPPAVAAELACRAPLFGLDANGGITHGSRAAVVEAAARGEPLRVGWRIVWGEKPGQSVMHWADARFVSVFEGNVFTQLPLIHAQHPVTGKSQVRFPDRLQQWHASIGTDGLLVSRMDGDATPKAKTVAQLWCLTDAAASACATPVWRSVYRHDADGKPVSGDKRRLFDAVRRGDPVRIAWGGTFDASGSKASVEHSVDVVFASITSGTELYVQVPEHILQRSYHQADQAGFDAPGHLWRAEFGTNGTFEAVVVDRGTGKVVRRLHQRAAITWSVFAPEPRCDARPVPELAIPGGVRAAATPDKGKGSVLED